MTSVSSPDEEWVTWPQAAALAGVPVPTIDWYTRTGRIRTRVHRGRRPSVNRASVAEFATWYADREAERATRRGARRRPPTRERPAGERQRDWLTNEQAAEILGIGAGRVRRLWSTGLIDGELEARVFWVKRADVEQEAGRRDRAVIATAAARMLGVSPETVRRLWRTGELTGEQVAGRLFLDREKVEQERERRSRWLSRTAAAQLVGCPVTAIEAAVKKGKIEARVTARALPSLSRPSVEAFAASWAEEKAQRGEEQERRRQRLEEAKAARVVRRHGPQDGYEWLSAAQTGAVLGLSRTGILAAARGDRLPHEVVGGRRWFRRDHVDCIARARAAERARVTEPGG